MGLGLSAYPLLFYFIYMWGIQIVRLVSFWQGLFRGFKGNDFVPEYESAYAIWKTEIIDNFLA